MKIQYIHNSGIEIAFAESKREYAYYVRSKHGDLAFFDYNCVNKQILFTFKGLIFFTLLYDQADL